MNENTSLCWDCHEVRTCLQANARGTVACSAYNKQQPHPPGPPRPPIGAYCADRLWANTPEHLHPKPQDQHRDDLIKSLETTVLEQADTIESLSAECERYRIGLLDISALDPKRMGDSAAIEAARAIAEAAICPSGFNVELETGTQQLQGRCEALERESDALLAFVEQQAAKIERLTWIDYGDGPASVFCRHCSRKKPKHTPGCPAGEE